MNIVYLYYILICIASFFKQERGPGAPVHQREGRACHLLLDPAEHAQSGAVAPGAVESAHSRATEFALARPSAGVWSKIIKKMDNENKNMVVIGGQWLKWLCIPVSKNLRSLAHQEVCGLKY